MQIDPPADGHGKPVHVHVLEYSREGQQSASFDMAFCNVDKSCLEKSLDTQIHHQLGSALSPLARKYILRSRYGSLNLLTLWCQALKKHEEATRPLKFLGQRDQLRSVTGTVHQY